MRILRSVAALSLLTVAAACSDDGSSSGGASGTTTSVTTSAASTTAAVTSSTAATATSTTAASTTTAAASTSVGITSTTLCEAPTTTDPVEVDFPQKMSSLYGDDVDTGGHLCFERFVINFAGSGDTPGYSVKYEADPLILASSGEPTELRGNANLIVTVNSWMGQEGAYLGETQLFPLNVDKIDEVKLIDNFEGMMIWGLGLDQERPFEVFTLPDPFRIVVDIATA